MAVHRVVYVFDDGNVVRRRGEVHFLALEHAGQLELDIGDADIVRAGADIVS